VRSFILIGASQQRLPVSSLSYSSPDSSAPAASPLQTRLQLIQRALQRQPALLERIIDLSELPQLTLADADFSSTLHSPPLLSPPQQVKLLIELIAREPEQYHRVLPALCKKFDGFRTALIRDVPASVVPLGIAAKAAAIDSSDEEAMEEFNYEIEDIMAASDAHLHLLFDDDEIDRGLELSAIYATDTDHAFASLLETLSTFPLPQFICALVRDWPSHGLRGSLDIVLWITFKYLSAQCAKLGEEYHRYSVAWLLAAKGAGINIPNSLLLEFMLKSSLQFFVGEEMKVLPLKIEGDRENVIDDQFNFWFGRASPAFYVKKDQKSKAAQ